MKKVILFVAVTTAFSFASCKKDRVCTCTDVTVSNGQTQTSDPQIITYNKATASQAESKCLNATVTGTTTILGVAVTYTTTRTCSLK